MDHVVEMARMSAELLGYFGVVGFGGSIVVVSAIDAFVSGIKALLRFAGQ